METAQTRAWATPELDQSRGLAEVAKTREQRLMEEAPVVQPVVVEQQVEAAAAGRRGFCPDS